MNGEQGSLASTVLSTPHLGEKFVYTLAHVGSWVFPYIFNVVVLEMAWILGDDQ